MVEGQGVSNLPRCRVCIWSGCFMQEEHAAHVMGDAGGVRSLPTLCAQGMRPTLTLTRQGRVTQESRARALSLRGPESPVRIKMPSK